MLKLKKWKFVPCITQSHARVVLTEYIIEKQGTQYKLGVYGAIYGFWYR